MKPQSPVFSVPRLWLNRLTALAFVALLPTALAAEDLTIVSTVSTAKGEPRTATQYITEGKVRSAEGNTDTILDYETGTMTFVDHKKKQYWQTNREEIEAQFAELSELLEGNPILSRMFGKGGEVSVDKTGETRTIAGYPCVRYVLTLGKAYELELWAADGLMAPVQYHDARKAFYTTLGPMAGHMEKLFEEMQKIEGLPLATTFRTQMMGRSFESLTEAIEVKAGPVPANAFDPPAGYKQKKSPYAKKK